MLCTCRMILGLIGVVSLLRIGTDRTAPERDLDLEGTRIVVPALHRTDGSDDLEYVIGEVTERFETSNQDVFSVRLDDGEELVLALERVE